MIPRCSLLLQWVGLEDMSSSLEFKSCFCHISLYSFRSFSDHTLLRIALFKQELQGLFGLLHPELCLHSLLLQCVLTKSPVLRSRSGDAWVVHSASEGKDAGA